MMHKFQICPRTLIVLCGLLFLGGTVCEVYAEVDVAKYESKKNVKKLIKVLRDTELDLQIRRTSMQALVRLQDSRAVEPLIDLLTDETSRLRADAASALGRLKDGRATGPLIATLTDIKLRRASATALGRIGGESATQALVGVLTDKPSVGRREAASALSNLGWKPMSDMEIAYYQVALEDWDACVALGEPALEPLVYALMDGDENARLGAVSTLQRLGWKPEKAHEAAYDAALLLKQEVADISHLVVLGETRLRREYEANLQYLKENRGSGDAPITEEEINSVKERFAQHIRKEQEYIDEFRAEFEQIRLTIRRHNGKLIVGKRDATENVVVFSVVRTHARRVTGAIWRNKWTGKPIKEFEWKENVDNFAKANFYKYDAKGNKYVFAEFYFSLNRRHLVRIDFIDPDGSSGQSTAWHGQALMPTFGPLRTRIGQDSWVDWPKHLAQERLKYIEAKAIASERSVLR